MCNYTDPEVLSKREALQIKNVLINTQYDKTARRCRFVVPHTFVTWMKSAFLLQSYVVD